MSAPPDRRATAGRDLAAELDDGQFGWLVTFSDLVLQLFAFIVVAVATGGMVHREVAGRSDRVAYDEPAALAIAAAPPAAPGATTAPQPAGEPAAPAATTGAPPAAERTEPQPGAPAAAPPGTAPEDHADARMTALGSYLGELVAATPPRGAVEVRTEAGEVRIAFDGIAGFAPGSAELSPAMLPALASLREVVAENTDLEVHIAGHTDDVPIHSALYGSNLDLSLARALAVARALGSGDPEVGRRIVASGFAERRPIASNAIREGRSQNRRVEVRLVAGAPAVDDAAAVEERIAAAPPPSR